MHSSPPHLVAQHCSLAKLAPPRSQIAANGLEVTQLPGCSAEDAGSLVDLEGKVTIPLLVDKLQHKSIKILKKLMVPFNGLGGNRYIRASSRHCLH
jgi:hypothetical protein